MEDKCPYCGKELKGSGGYETARSFRRKWS